VDDDLKHKLKVALAATGGLATGMVFFGPAGAIVIGGAAGWLSYQWLGPAGDHTNNASPSTD
jgi:hypothetical protein